ncbi:hypothetical protein V6N13_135022 [Hibiscus sabdariffa]|uniref:Uncharacterized protein n=1 Tax=Hibiscus sabdariffa TaxID=183260 RepID=A0ABR2R5W1_9ROSI
MADSSGTTLIDLILADPSSVPASTSSSSLSKTAAEASPSATQQPQHVSTKTALGEKKSKRAALMQIQHDTISVAKAALIKS